MKILFITDNFPPETAPPASRTYEHIREWNRMGHKVTVITSFPNFPFGKIYKGYKNKLWEVENMKGIKVIRVWTFIAENKGFLLRVIDFLSFMLTSFFAGIFVKKHDLIIGTSPQFFTVCSAWALSKIKSTPWVFELRDIWPESLKAVDISQNNTLIKFFEKIEIFLYKSADLIISVTHSFKESLIQRGIDSKKIHVITNGVDANRFQYIPKDKSLLKEFNLQNKFVVSYIGTHGMAHSIETIVNAARLIEDSGLHNDIIFLLLGSGSEKTTLKKYIEENNINNILMLDPVKRDLISKYWSITDISVVHLRESKLFETVIPSKIFESMAMGKPILLGVKGETKKIIENTSSGIYFEPENSEQLKDLVLKFHEDKNLLSQFTDNALNASKEYNRKKLAENMIEIIQTKIMKNND